MPGISSPKRQGANYLTPMIISNGVHLELTSLTSLTSLDDDSVSNHVTLSDVDVSGDEAFEVPDFVDDDTVSGTFIDDEQSDFNSAWAGSNHWEPGTEINNKQAEEMAHDMNQIQEIDYDSDHMDNIISLCNELPKSPTVETTTLWDLDKTTTRPKALHYEAKSFTLLFERPELSPSPAVARRCGLWRDYNYEL